MKLPFSQRDVHPMTDAESAVRVAETQAAAQVRCAELDAETRRECAEIAARAQVWSALIASARFFVLPGVILLLHII